DPAHAVRLLRPRRQRPRRCRAAEQGDELPSLHSITSSARASSVGGTSRPRAFAVFRLRTSSIFTACSTGRSAGLVPRRTFPVKMPTRWYASARLSGRDAANREDYRDLPAHQLGRQGRQAVNVILRPAVLDRDVSILEKTCLVEAPSKCGYELLAVIERSAAQNSNHRHRRLLRPRRERPRCRTAEQRYELAPFHCPMPPVLPTERIAHPSTAGDCCAAGFQLRLCRLGVTTGHSAMSAHCPPWPHFSDSNRTCREVREVTKPDS